jgi:hypothetical protein
MSNIWMRKSFVSCSINAKLIDEFSVERFNISIIKIKHADISYGK